MNARVYTRVHPVLLSVNRERALSASCRHEARRFAKRSPAGSLFGHPPWRGADRACSWRGVFPRSPRPAWATRGAGEARTDRRAPRDCYTLAAFHEVFRCLREARRGVATLDRAARVQGNVLCVGARERTFVWGRHGVPAASPRDDRDLMGCVQFQTKRQAVRIDRVVRMEGRATLLAGHRATSRQLRTTSSSASTCSR